MGSIFSSTFLPKEEQKEDGWVIVDEEEALALAEAKVEQEEEEEDTNILCFLMQNFSTIKYNLFFMKFIVSE